MGTVCSNRCLQRNSIGKYIIPRQLSGALRLNNNVVTLKVNFCSCKVEFKMSDTNRCGNRICRYKGRYLYRKNSGHTVNCSNEWCIQGCRQFTMDIEFKSLEQFGLSVNYIA